METANYVLNRLITALCATPQLPVFSVSMASMRTLGHALAVLLPAKFAKLLTTVPSVFLDSMLLEVLANLARQDAPSVITQEIV